MEYMIYVWAGVIALSLIIEFVSQEFVSIWFAASGLISLILAACNVGLAWQIPVFVVISLALVFATRPLIKKFVKKPTVATNADSLIGQKSKLLTKITENENGTIKFKGVVWSATASEPIEAGDEVIVAEINGNTLTVKKVENQTSNNKSTKNK